MRITASMDTAARIPVDMPARALARIDRDRQLATAPDTTKMATAIHAETTDRA
jgi:hypothetical protein